MIGGGLSAWAHALPNNARGAIWALAAVAMFGTMDALVKYLGGALHPLQLVFFRSLFAFLAIAPLVFAYGRRVFHTRQLSGHFLRAVLGYGAMSCGFIALTHLPLAEAVALNYVRALFLVPLAVVMLGEAADWRRWVAMGVGFGGVLVMLRPGAGVFDIWAIFPLISGFFVAIVSVLMKRLAESERPEPILFWFAAFTSILSLGPAITVWRWPVPEIWPYLLLMGFIGTAGQYFIVRAFRLTEATTVDSLDYTKLIYTGLIGLLVFGEPLTLPTIAGALLIVASTFYIARFASRRKKPA